jgi:hypothetical protein
MVKTVIQTLQRLLALLAVTGALSQGAGVPVSEELPSPDPPTAAREAQFPYYTALLPDTSRFEGDTYIGDNALVLLERHTRKDGALSSAYTYAEIYLPDVHCLRTWYMDDPDDDLVGTADIRTASRAVRAAFAVNGDFYNLQGVNAVRNGTVINSCVCTYDLCVLYEDGRMKTYSPDDLPTQGLVDAALTDAWQAWSFGPLLLTDDGEAIPDFSERTNEYLTRLHPRTAIGYFAPGHYCIVSITGYQNGNPGVSLEELSAFFASLGCKQAYNLDGGGSTHIWYHGHEIGYPSEARALADLIYIRNTAEER